MWQLRPGGRGVPWRILSPPLTERMQGRWWVAGECSLPSRSPGRPAAGPGAWGLSPAGLCFPLIMGSWVTTTAPVAGAGTTCEVCVLDTRASYRMWGFLFRKQKRSSSFLPKPLSPPAINVMLPWAQGYSWGQCRPSWVPGATLMHT